MNVGYAFLADMSRGDLVDISEPAIVVINLATGATRRVLEGHPILQPKTDAPSRAGGRVITLTKDNGDTELIHLGLNPIGIDPLNINLPIDCLALRRWYASVSEAESPVYRGSYEA